MRRGARGAVRPGVIVVAVSSALALATAVVLFVALDGDDDPTRPTTTTAPPTTTTTVVIERQVSLVADDQSGPLFDVAGVEVTASDLLGVEPDSAIPERYPVVIDSDFVDAQEEADLSLTRLRGQVQFLANRLGPAIQEARVEPPLVVVARPRLADGALDAAVMVVNVADTARRLAFFDLRILDTAGSPATERVRFLEATGGVELPPMTAYFNLVAFSGAQVSVSEADVSTYSWAADVRWTDPSAEAR